MTKEDNGIKKLNSDDLHNEIVDIKYIHEGTFTLCILTLRNGCKIEGKSACMNPKDYSKMVGKKLAFDDAFSKIWELLGFYRMQDKFEKEGTNVPNSPDDVTAQESEIKFDTDEDTKDQDISKSIDDFLKPKLDEKFKELIEKEESFDQKEEDFRVLAELGHRNTQFYLGVVYKDGNLVKKNDIKAIYYLSLAVKQGCVASQRILQKDCNIHFGFNKIQPISEEDMETMYHSLFSFCRFSKESFDETTTIIRGLADAGYTIAQWFIGGTYRKENDALAIYYLTEAANQGHKEAIGDLRKYYNITINTGDK